MSVANRSSPNCVSKRDDDGGVELVALRDRSLVTVRPTRAEDEAALRLFLGGLCADARRLRFFTGAPNLRAAAHLGAATGAGRYGLIARSAEGVVVGHATYVQIDAQSAEVAVEVADDLHGQGLGTTLIARLSAHAEGLGITHFVAELLCENSAMLDVFREGFDARVISSDGPQESVEFLTAGWRLVAERF